MNNRMFVMIFPLLLCVGILGGSQGDDVDKGLQELQGNWDVIDAETDGERPKTPIGMRITINKDKMVTFGANIGEKESWRFKVDPTKKPKAIDLIRENSKTPILGIYIVEGNTLKLCYCNELPGDRPKDFSTKKGSPNVLMILKRVNPKR